MALPIPHEQTRPDQTEAQLSLFVFYKHLSSHRYDRALCRLLAIFCRPTLPIRMSGDIVIQVESAELRRVHHLISGRSSESLLVETVSQVSWGLRQLSPCLPRVVILGRSRSANRMVGRGNPKNAKEIRLSPNYCRNMNSRPFLFCLGAPT